MVHCIDRFQRGFKECTEIEQLLKEDRIEVHFYKEGLVLHKDSPSSDLAQWDFGILSAKLYINSMRDNVKRSMNYNWSQGKWQGLAPLGYLNARDNSNKATLILDQERAPLIRRLFEEYATGTCSLQGLWELAKEIGLRSKQSNYYKQPKNRTKSGLVSRNKIHDILSDPFYFGLMRIKGQLIPHIYPPIIDKALFDKVQELRTGRRTRPIKDTNEAIPFAFRGLITCSKCDCAMTSETHIKDSGKTFTYLKCTQNKGKCRQPLVNEKKLFEQLDREIFSNIHVSSSVLDLLKNEVRKRLDSESDVNASAKRNITNSLNALKSKEDRLFDFYLEGNIDKTTYDIKKSEIEAERQELNKTSEKYAVIGDTMKQIVENVLEVAAKAPMIMRYANPDQKRELLSLLLTDCVMDNKVLKYTLQKPFDKLITTPAKDWVNVPVEHFIDFVDLENNVKMFQKNMKKEEVAPLIV